MTYLRRSKSSKRRFYAIIQIQPTNRRIKHVFYPQSIAVSFIRSLRPTNRRLSLFMSCLMIGDETGRQCVRSDAERGQNTGTPVPVNT